MDKKEKYESVKLELVKLDVSDVILTSTPEEGDFDYGGWTKPKDTTSTYSWS